jgi:hypothetical protein
MRILATFMTILLLTACGHKGPVRPLGEQIPVAPRDLSGLQQGDSFLLSWKIPTRNEDGSTLDNLLGFRVMRMDFNSDTPCATCRDTSREVHFVDLEYMDESQRKGDVIYLTDHDIQPGFAYRYHVAAVTTQNEIGIRATMDKRSHQPPLPPQNLNAEGLDRLVRLTWDEPLVPSEDAELLGYLIYRSSSDEPMPLTPITKKPIAGTNYEDLGVPNDTLLRYVIRTVLKIDNKEVYSSPAEETSVTPRKGR